MINGSDGYGEQVHYYGGDSNPFKDDWTQVYQHAVDTSGIDGWGYQ
jgi:hypothetical protein